MINHPATIDRRQDVGSKISWLLIAAMVAGFANSAWSSAQRGMEKADKAIEMVNEDKNRITRLETEYEGITYRLEEIKLLIKSVH